jgi:hypothetical protein
MAAEILVGRLPEGNCKRNPWKEHLQWLRWPLVRTVF